QEIAFGVADPATAARLFAKNAIHAYIGPLTAPKGAELAWVESFRGFVVLTFNPASRAFADARERCAAAARLAPALATAKTEYVAYPYPVTPWHEDYAHHADLVEAAKTRTATAGPIPRLRVRRGFAGVAAGPAWRPADAEWDATLEEVSLGELLRDETAWLNGWTSPPWLKEGWFHAHALSARAVTDPSSRIAIEEMLARPVKLKGLPWNGWLRVSTATRPAAAWNPIAGFSDEAGTLIWSVLGHAAVLPEPSGVGWLPNRVRAVEVSGPVEMAPDALAPEL